MSSLKYKSTTNPSSSSSGANNLPIWCSLSTPSQIARKYASIAPIWCHISRPRQLKQKFKSTFNTATNLLSRQHSKDDRSHRDDSDDGNRFNDMSTAINTFKNANNTWKSSNAASATTNMPSSSSKNKISVNNYDNSELTSILKKRENSLELKKNALTSPYSTSVGSRWNSSIKKPETSTYDNNNASTIVGSFYEENHLPSMSSHTGESTRRPNKYVSKYSGAKSVGSKTEKIISKSSKSSPNLLYEPSTGSKWQSSNYTPSNQYHSSNYGSGNNYSSYNYQPITTSNSNNAVSNSYNKNNDTNYNNNNNREEKWNELDTMLGAQSALLSRLESDFVNNRNKLKNPTSTTTNTNNNSTYSGQRNGIAATSTPSYQSSTSSIKYQPENKPIKKPMKYTSSKTEKISHADTSENQFQKFSSRKAEPIIDLLNSLDLNEGPREKPTEMTESYNLEIDSKLKSNKDPLPSNKNENMDEFVDDFINDYLGNTMKATEPIDPLKAKISANSTNSNAKLNNVVSTTSSIPQPTNRTNSTSSITSANSTNNSTNYNGNTINYSNGNLNTVGGAASVVEVSASKNAVTNEKSEPEPMKSNWYGIYLKNSGVLFNTF